MGIDEGSKYIQCVGTNHEERCIALLRRSVTQRFSICNVTFDQRVARTITTVATHIRLTGDLRLYDDSFVRQMDASAIVRGLLTALITFPEVRFKHMYAVTLNVNDALLGAFDEANVDSIFVSSTHITVTDDGLVSYMLEKPPSRLGAKSVHFDAAPSALTRALFEKLVTVCPHSTTSR